MKHVELQAHYLRQLIHDNVISLEYCKIDYHVVDIFTKPLSKAKIIKLYMMLGLQEDTIMGGVMMTQFHLSNLQKCVLMGGVGTVDPIN
jgi:hypothetical protein